MTRRSAPMRATRGFGAVGPTGDGWRCANTTTLQNANPHSRLLVLRINDYANYLATGGTTRYAAGVSGAGENCYFYGVAIGGVVKIRETMSDGAGAAKTVSVDVPKRLGANVIVVTSSCADGAVNGYEIYVNGVAGGAPLTVNGAQALASTAAIGLHKTLGTNGLAALTEVLAWGGSNTVAWTPTQIAQQYIDVIKALRNGDPLPTAIGFDALWDARDIVPFASTWADRIGGVNMLRQGYGTHEVSVAAPPVHGGP